LSELFELMSRRTWSQSTTVFLRVVDVMLSLGSNRCVPMRLWCSWL